MSEIQNNREFFKTLTVLFVPNDGLENMTSHQVLADELQERGHKVIFAVDIASKGLITYNGLEEDLNELPKDVNANEINDYKSELNFDAFKLSAIEVFEKFSLKCLRKKFYQNKERDLYYEKLIQRIKPDVIIVESMLCSPALTNSGIPWIWLNFGAPNKCIDDERLPPAWSGLSIKAENENWSQFIEQKEDLLKGFRKELNSWCASRGGSSLPQNSLHPESPYLNIYVYPRGLDCDPIKEFPPQKWIRINCLMNENENNIEIPKELEEKPGKLIYFSMDSYGSADIDLMKRWITIFSQSENKFIVSKGQFDNDYELPENMRSVSDLSSTEAIKLADLVITSGDTNSITEAMFYGKPMIVMPLFGDQLDNAQMVKESGFGIILEPYKTRIATTFGSINAMLADFSTQRRLGDISYDMKNSNERKTLCALIEDVVNQ